MSAGAQRQQAVAISARIIAAYPGTFAPNGEVCRPLAIGTCEALIAALPGLKPWQVAAFLRWYCSRVHYQRALEAGGSRINLAGETEGEVTPEQQAAAKEAARLLNRADRAKKKSRKAATKAAAGKAAAATDFKPVEPLALNPVIAKPAASSTRKPVVVVVRKRAASSAGPRDEQAERRN